MFRSVSITVSAAVAVVLAAVAPDSFSLRLPTGNDAIFTGNDAAFYQHTVRRFQGERSRPWQGGQYGFVRNPDETGGQILFTRLHEGIDVKPLHRDARGEPLDTVRAISPGRIVYVNEAPADSDYGRYVVVEHRWEGSPFFSLYAHLARVTVDSGRAVRAGEELGTMGHSGRGLSRSRAHLHLEVAMLLNETFDAWYYAHFHDEPNFHGIYSGLNLVGLDVERLYRAHRRDSSLSIRRFVRDRPIAYEVAVPNRGALDLIDRYPWLMDDSPAEAAPAWVIGFTRTGVPVRIRTGSAEVDAPTLVGVDESTERVHRCVAAGYLARQDGECVLTRNGRRYAELLVL